MFLITGATGHIGRELIPNLLLTGQPIRVLVRDARKVAHLDPQIERCVGDLDKPETLISAMKGVERIFLVTFDIRQDISVLEAAKRAGVHHIVKLSTLEASDRTLQIGRWHRECEERIEASGLNWTFIRPGMFMSNAVDWWADTIKQQGAVYFPGGKGKVAPVSPEDIAAVAAMALTQPGHHSQIYELTGSELLSMGEMVQIIAKALGKPLQYTDIPPIAAKLWMLKSGMDKPLVNALMEMLASLRKNKGAVVTQTIEQILGRPPIPFEGWCQSHVDAFQLNSFVRR